MMKRNVGAVLHNTESVCVPPRKPVVQHIPEPAVRRSPRLAAEGYTHKFLQPRRKGVTFDHGKEHQSASPDEHQCGQGGGSLHGGSVPPTDNVPISRGLRAEHADGGVGVLRSPSLRLVFTPGQGWHVAQDAGVTREGVVHALSRDQTRGRAGGPGCRQG